MLISSRSGRTAALFAVAAIAVGACSSGSSPAPSASAAASAPAAPSAAASAPASAAASSSASQASRADGRRSSRSRSINPYFDAAKVGADKAAGELGATVTQVGPSYGDRGPVLVHPGCDDPGRQSHRDLGERPERGRARPPGRQWRPASRSSAIDSSPAVGAYDVFVNQTDFNLHRPVDGRLGVRPRTELHRRDRHPLGGCDGVEPEQLDRQHEDRPAGRQVQGPQARRHRLR